MSPWPPLPTNISSPQLLATYMNSATSDFSWTGILFAVFAVMLIALNYRVDSKDAFVASAFVCMILSVLMRALNLIPESIMNLTVILAIIGIAIIWLRGRASY